MLRLFGTATAHTLFVQMLLGLAAYVVVLMMEDETTADVIVATAHQGLGAALLAFAALLMVWSRKLLAPGAAAPKETAPAA